MSDALPPPPGDFPPPGQIPPPAQYPPGGQYPPPAIGGDPGYGYQQHGYGYAYAHAPVFAGFWRRFVAVFLDGLILAIPLNIVVLALGVDSAVSFLVRIAASAAYYAVLEGGPNGQTLGKMALGVRVVDANSIQPGIGPGRAIGRYFAKFLSGIALALGYLWMLWDPRKQTWHDKLASTLVIKT